MRTLPALIAAALLLSSCESKRQPAPTAASATASAPLAAPADPAVDKTQAAAVKLGGAVKSRLVEAMNSGGPAKAIEVCSSEAQQIAAKVQQETGVKLGRSSLRLRNPKDTGPAWVEEWLKAQGERKAEGAKGIRGAFDGPEGKVARFLKPIEIEPVCLSCHGDPATIAPEVKAVLSSKYPGDKATGYALGDLRGALWAEASITAN